MTIRPRIVALDVVRGFALGGILLVNVRPIAGAGEDPAWLGVVAQQRFHPIFALLFGIGFALLLDSAAARTDRPRVVLLRRLLALLAIGLVHRLALWGGDILTVYALVGLLVLLPSTWLPRWAVAGLAVVVTVAALVLAGGGVILVAGLFLAGAALVRCGAIDRIGGPAPVLLGGAFAVLAVPALWWQVAVGGADEPMAAQARGVAGLLLAGVYVCTLLVLLRTPLRAVLAAVFVPLGRMALTNYLGATVAVLLVAAVLGNPQQWSTTVVLGIVGTVLAVQWAFSTLWLHHYRQGPLEWLWRWATWGRRPPLRR